MSLHDGSDIFVSDTGGSLFQRDRTEMATERFQNFSDEVTEGQSSIRVEEERVE